MGYYTKFELSVFDGTVDLQAVKERLDKIMEMEGAESFFFVDDGVIASEDPLVWSDHDAECAELSLALPGVVLKLHGEGEDAGDAWDAYYKEGRCQICRAKLVYPPYDQSKLTSVWSAQSGDSEDSNR